jgi:hypothetical protein
MAAACSNGLAIALLAASTYAAARVWFGAAWAAVVALLFLTSPSFYGEFLLLGTPDVWFAAIFVPLLWLWSSFDPADPRPRLGLAVGLGVLGGLAYLSRFNANVFLAVQVVWLLRYRRWREAALMVVIASAIASPMLIYNWNHFGRPLVSIYSAWNLLGRIGAYRVEPWLYYQVPDVGRVLMEHRAGFARKFLYDFGTVVPRGIWSLWRLDVLMPLALVGPWFASRGTSFRRFAAWSVGFVALQLVLFSALRLEFVDRNSPHNGRYFFWFAAPAVLIGVGTLRRISTSRRWVLRLAVLAVLGQLTLFGMAWYKIARWHLSSRIDMSRMPIYGVLGRIVRDGRAIASNQPQLTAWFQGLRSISLPANPGELDRLNRDSPTPIDYVFIEMDYNAIQLDPDWMRFIATDPRQASPWEPRLLRDYDYVFPPASTRPINYVLLRRKSVPPSELEREMSGELR